MAVVTAVICISSSLTLSKCLQTDIVFQCRMYFRVLQEVLNLSELTEQIDSLRDNMTFIQDNVNECQNAIVHMEEFKVQAPATHTRLFSNWPVFPRSPRVRLVVSQVLLGRPLSSVSS